MNPTDAEIAERIDGMESDDVVVKNIAGKWLNLFPPNQGEPEDEISFIPTAFLAFCRAVVSKIDGPAKTTDIVRPGKVQCNSNQCNQREPVAPEEVLTCEICGDEAVSLTTRMVCDRCYVGENIKPKEPKAEPGLICCNIIGGKGNELWIVDMPWGNSIALYKAVGRKDFAYIETEIGDKFLSMQAFDDPPVRAWFRK